LKTPDDYESQKLMADKLVELNCSNNESRSKKSRGTITVSSQYDSENLDIDDPNPQQQ